MSCWFITNPTIYSSTTLNGTLSNNICYACGNREAAEYQNGCNNNGNKTCKRCPHDTSNIKTSNAQAYPYSNKTTKSLTIDTSSDTNILQLPTRVEWYPFVKSKYYKIKVYQNNKNNLYTIESNNECKQTADILIVASIPANITIFGCDIDPKIKPNQSVNDYYKTRYTVKTDESNNYIYENLATTRRTDKETGSNVIYETSLVEGVSYKFK